MNWRWIGQFPKYALAGLIFLGSTALFATWWFLNHSEWTRAAAKREKERREAVRQVAETLPKRLGTLALVGSDLYDAATGERLLVKWLRGVPQKLYYDSETDKLIVVGQNGILRFNRDGSRAGELAVDSIPIFTQDLKQAVFVRGGDVWQAEVDWQAFKLVNERQVTAYGKFMAAHFSANVVMFSPRALVVRSLTQFLWVNLETGQFQPVTIPLKDIAKRRSPGGRFLLGEEAGSFFCYDVETNERWVLTKDWNEATDFQWLDEERCLVLADRGQLWLHERPSGTSRHVAELPGEFLAVMFPSPGGRYVFCVGERNGVILADLVTSELEPVDKQGQNLTWVGDDTILCSVELPDTAQRGTWLKKLGSPWLRILPEPYVVQVLTKAKAVAVLKPSGQVLLGTRDALWRVEAEGSAPVELTKLPRPVTVIQAVDDWKEAAQR